VAKTTLSTRRDSNADIVFELGFGDGVFWIARIPPPSGSGFSISIEEMRNEIATVNVVKRHSAIPVPGVYGHDFDSGGVGGTYILFQALPGRTLPQRNIRWDGI
jgi:hypothetical protein